MKNKGYRSLRRKHDCLKINHDTNFIYHRSINVLPRTFQRMVANVTRETGYAVVVLWGGPQINENGSIGTWQYVIFQTISFYHSSNACYVL